MAETVKIGGIVSVRPGSTLANRLSALFSQSDASGAVMAFMVRIAGAGLGYLLHILLARLLGASEFGLWATSWTLLLVVGHAASFGFSESVVRFYTAYAARSEWARAKAFLVFGSIFSIAFGCALAAFAWAALLFMGAELPDGMTAPLMFAALALPFFAFQDCLEGIARAFGRPVLALAPVYVLRPCLIAVLLTGIAMSAQGADADADAGAAMAATFVAIVIATLLQALLVWRAAPGPVRKAKPDHLPAEWIKGSAPLAAVFLVDQLAAYADILALAIFASAADTGAYFAAARIIALAGLAPYAVSVIAGRGYALHHARNDAAELYALVRRTTRCTFWASCALLVLLVLAGPVLLAMFGRDFQSAAPCLILLGLGLVARAAGGHAEELLIALGHQRENVRIAVVSAVAAVLLTFLAAAAFGPAGAAAAMMCAWSIRSLLFVRSARRLTGIYTGLGRDTFSGVSSH